MACANSAAEQNDGLNRNAIELRIKWTEAKKCYELLKERKPYKGKLHEMSLREFEMKKAKARYKGYIKLLETLSVIRSATH